MRKIIKQKFICYGLIFIALFLAQVGCQKGITIPKEEISVTVWADAPRVQKIATASEILVSVTNQDKQNIPDVILRSKKLKGWVINSIKPKPSSKDKDEGVWVFNELPAGKSLNITFNVTPVETGHQAIDFTFESSKGYKLIRPNGTPAIFELEVSVGKVVEWEF